MKYYPDIDGLRAIAVLLVVFFHGGFGIFSGGFVGVDIFFVISGFLITSIILRDIKKNSFSIKNFYERRIRRIFPALYTVCTASLVLAGFIFLPNEFEAFGKSLSATLLFVSNILFWSETGYFDASADLKPLLHTWSLAVEEQFYIFFPILLVLTSRFLKGQYALIIIIIGLISFGVSVWGAEHKPSATFYWAPTRAWELMLGAILAFNLLPSIQKRLYAELLGLLGIGFIFYSAFVFDYDTSFPGFNAVFPCFGAALVIYSGFKYNTYVKRVLGSKPLVFIGLTSYSFYLWHWPIFVFAKYLSINHLSQIQSLGLILLSFVLAAITWKFIETPFRSREFLEGKWRIFLISFFAVIPLLLASIFIVTTKGMPNRFDEIEKLESYKGDIIDTACVDIKSSEFAEKRCYFGDISNRKKNPAFVVWGDSHAGAMVRAIGFVAEKQQKYGYLASISGCPPLLDIMTVRDSNPNKCKEENREIFNQIEKGQIVFLTARWTYYTRKSLISNEGPVWLNDQNSKEISEKENYSVLSNALTKTIKAIEGKGAIPVLVSTVPEFPRSVPETYFLFKKDITVSNELFLKNREKTHSLLISATGEKYTVIDPSSEFCGETVCIGNNGSDVFYSDNDHINQRGAKKVSKVFKYILESYLKD